jgi:hypothetical protein
VAAKYFSCLRRAAVGVHRHVAGSHFFYDAAKSWWYAQAKRSLALKPGRSITRRYPRGVRRRFTAWRRGLRATR